MVGVECLAQNLRDERAMSLTLNKLPRSYPDGACSLLSSLVSWMPIWPCCSAPGVPNVRTRPRMLGRETVKGFGKKFSVMMKGRGWVWALLPAGFVTLADHNIQSLPGVPGWQWPQHTMSWCLPSVPSCLSAVTAMPASNQNVIAPTQHSLCLSDQ